MCIYIYINIAKYRTTYIWNMYKSINLHINLIYINIFVYSKSFFIIIYFVFGKVLHIVLNKILQIYSATRCLLLHQSFFQYIEIVYMRLLTEG